MKNVRCVNLAGAALLTRHAAGRVTTLFFPIRRVLGIGPIQGHTLTFENDPTSGRYASFRDARRRWNDLREVTFYRRCPFASPGCVVHVRERWRPVTTKLGQRGIHYADPAAFLPIEEPRFFPHGWGSLLHQTHSQQTYRSPALMPWWAARFRYVVAGTDAVPVASLCEEDAAQAGYFPSSSFSALDKLQASLGLRQGEAHVWRLRVNRQPLPEVLTPP